MGAGASAATTATAHKIAVIFYTMIKEQTEYDETLWAAREAERDRRLEAKLKRQAHRLGFELVPIHQQPGKANGCFGAIRILKKIKANSQGGVCLRQSFLQTPDR